MRAASPQQFPHQRHYAWFNHALVGPPPQAAREAVAAYLQAIQEKGPWVGDHFERIVRDARSAAAKLINVKPGEICLTKSTTQGVQIVANSLRWRPGANIVLMEGDFPANYHSWRFAAEEEGLEIRRVPPDEGGRYPVEAFISRVDGMTQLVAASWVHYATGYRVDVKELGRACRERHVLTFVDAIQGLGAVPLDARECSLDFVASGSHKWLLGMEGSGFLYIREGVPERLMNRRMAGWLGAEDPMDFEDPDPPFSRDARRFEEGSRNMIGMTAMTAAMHVLRAARLGADTLPVSSDATGSVQDSVFRSILEITDRLASGLVEMGMGIRSPMRHPGERSGILSFQHPRMDPETLCEHLAERRIHCSARGSMVRLSPHFYTTDEEIMRFLSELHLTV